MELRQLASYELQTKGLDEATSQFDRLDATQKRAGAGADVLSRARAKYDELAHSANESTSLPPSH